MNIEDRNFSVLLIKADSQHLGADARRELDETIDRHANGMLLTQGLTVILSADEARSLWGESISQYSWADHYCETMAGPSTFYFLKGQDSGKKVKALVRQDMASHIDSLKQVLATEFSPDLIHASDPGQEEKEMALLLSILARQSPELMFSF